MIIISIALILGFIVMNKATKSSAFLNTNLMTFESPTNTKPATGEKNNDDNGASTFTFKGAISTSADEVWNDLLKEGSVLMNKNHQTFKVLEVGMNRIQQTLQAAISGFEAHGLEPSPTSFSWIKGAEDKIEDKKIRDLIHLYNVAAGGSPGMVDFKSTGSTGDMVGGDGADMWKMTRGKRTSAYTDDQNVVQVQTVRLDNLISEKISPTSSTDNIIFLAKIDVQGYEPFVFQGLSESIKSNRIMYYLFEYWPKGMDFIQEVPFDSDEICKASVKILDDLASAGYQLFALSAHVHPHSYSHFSTKMTADYLSKLPDELQKKKLGNVIQSRPLDNLMDNCKWYYQLEKIFPQDDYYMGFWSDVLAVAPNAQLPVNPITNTGIALSK